MCLSGFQENAKRRSTTQIDDRCGLLVAVVSLLSTQFYTRLRRLCPLLREHKSTVGAHQLIYARSVRRLESNS